MRTTLNIDDALLRRAKTRAAQTDRSLSAFVQDAIRAALAHKPRVEQRERIELPTVHGRLRHGVNYGSFADLMELTEKGSE